VWQEKRVPWPGRAKILLNRGRQARPQPRPPSNVAAPGADWRRQLFSVRLVRLWRGMVSREVEASASETPAGPGQKNQKKPGRRFQNGRLPSLYLVGDWRPACTPTGVAGKFCACWPLAVSPGRCHIDGRAHDGLAVNQDAATGRGGTALYSTATTLASMFPTREGEGRRRSERTMSVRREVRGCAIGQGVSSPYCPTLPQGLLHP
jgi:hypothetical protein